MTQQSSEPVSLIRLLDGRVLAYAECGDRDGTPLFYFHGVPGSRLDFTGWYGDESLSGSGVRLIGLDRPGFGQSTFQEGRRFDDWPNDVDAVATELGLERFGVLGYSMGGPYVVACAEKLRDRLIFAGIVSGVGPAEMPRFRQGLNRADRTMLRLSRWASPLGRALIAQATRIARRSPEKFSRQFDRELSPPDREIHAEPRFRELVREVFLESARSGPGGIVRDYWIWGRPSGFAYDRIEFPVRLWHGQRDSLVPLHHSEYFAGQLANAELTVLQSSGHLHRPDQWREVFTAAAKRG